MIKFKFPVGSATLTIEAETARDLVSEFEAVGGDGAEMITKVKAAAANPFAVTYSTLEEVSSEPQNGETTSAEAADPWADPAPTTPTALPSEQADPWASDDAPQPAKAAAGKAKLVTITDNYGREFTLGVPEAPECDCGKKAARMKANAKTTGKAYSKWVCAKGSTEEWRDKCDYSEFTNKK